MKIQDLFEESYSALVSNKVRSSLTILGIVIGIGSVIALVAIGQGAQSSIQANIQSIGSNLIIVTPGAQRSFGAGASSGRGSAQTLTKEDADAITKQVTLASAVAPESSSRYQLIVKGKNTNTSVIGTVPNYVQVRSITIDIGVFISDSQVRDSAKVAVIGPTTRDDLFGVGINPIGQIIKIKQLDFRVIGVTKSKGGSGFSNQDDVVFIPLPTMQHYLAGTDYLTTVSIQAQTPELMPTVQQQVTNLLTQRHNISGSKAADFTVLNQADIVAAASGVTGTLTMLLAAIAGISLVVGGIGIMNMMLTTVTERTREIGLRKAIGASSYDINFQFLTEAVMLTFLGGFIGIILGWILSNIVGKLMSLTATMSLSSIALAFGVSAGIGLIFGYYPARRAAKLNPIEALRFE
ncbi:MAG: ABC transporter permease [Candidatus Falkowbacteria bacterium]|nr:ABC transporter permease [Candidatus Falkowbacteria bacterium]